MIYSEAERKEIERVYGVFKDYIHASKFWILSGLKSWGICCCISTQQKTPSRRTKSLLLRMNCVPNYSTKLQWMFFKKLRENTFILMQMMTRLRRFADVGSRISTCFLSIGVHAEHFTQQNKRKAAFSMICPYIVFSALFHCSLYRGHIIARASICFGNLELYFLAEQQQKYLLLTQPIHTKCGRLLLRTILNHAIHDGII